MFLIDSSVYIDTLRQGRDPIHVFSNEFETELLMTCGIVVCEVLRGIRDPNIFNRMESFFGLLHPVEFDDTYWADAYNLAWKMDRAGVILPLSDILIASAALATNATVVSSDKHFSSIPDLRVQDRISTSQQ